MRCTSSDIYGVGLAVEQPNYHLLKETIKKLEEDLEYSSPKSQEISRLFLKYQGNFSKVSNCFEIWGENRRRLIEKLSTIAKDIENTRRYCNQGIFALSSLTVIGSTLSLLLHRTNKLWAFQMFIGAATVSSLSFLCSLLDLYISKSKVEEIESTYQDDKYALDNLESEIRFGAFNSDIQNYFPNGVNYKIVKNLIEPQLTDRKEWHHFKNLFKDVDLASDDEKIFYAIVLSNIMRDPDLLNDTFFLAKVQAFSKSTLAEKWWNRLKYENSSHRTEKKNLLEEIKFFLKPEKLFVSSLSIAVFPLSSDIINNSVALALINVIVGFHAYGELKVPIEPKESITFRHLMRVLYKEYEELKKVYDLLNPYND